ncbi:MAG: archaeosortase [Archaeoglobi archaeon]|nr:archaeosortase [Archaeoglobi archaeon]MDK2781853.1 archaeosortase [Archaeoglobi archaeon]
MKILFLSLILLILASFLLKKRIVFFLAWISFALYWLSEIPYYHSIGDYYNIFILLSASFLCIIMGKLSLREVDDSLLFFTRVSATASSLYFIFLLVPALHDALIGALIKEIIIFSHLLGFSDVRWFGDSMVGIAGKPVKIIFACTGIESMVLFAGISLSSNGRISNRLLAFLVSVPVIYILNIFRNIFVIVAYGYSWFGEESFYVAHNVIAKLGATLALVAIAYAVLRLLPDVLEMIEKIWRRVREELWLLEKL